MSALDIVGRAQSRPARRGRTVATGLAATLMLAGSMTVGGAHAAAAAAPYTVFVTLDDLNSDSDKNFNQLLGINTDSVMVGYNGDGSVKPNKGYVLVGANHYSDENYPASAQTQVVGINNRAFPTTVGFWADAAGDNYGFADQFTTPKGDHFVLIANPNAQKFQGLFTTQLLGVNYYDVAAGFYFDSKGNSHGFTYDINAMKFSNVTLPFSKVVSFQATGINNANIISGFYTDTAAASHGFYGKQGSFKRVDIPKMASTMFFGLNNVGQLAGVVTDAKGATHGVVYDVNSKEAVIVDDPHASQTVALNVAGTLINGINDDGHVVGFFSDGVKVHGFYARTN